MCTNGLAIGWFIWYTTYRPQFMQNLTLLTIRYRSLYGSLIVTYHSLTLVHCLNQCRLKTTSLTPKPCWAMFTTTTLGHMELLMFASIFGRNSFPLHCNICEFRTSTVSVQSMGKIVSQIHCRFKVQPVTFRIIEFLFRNLRRSPYKQRT